LAAAILACSVFFAPAHASDYPKLDQALDLLLRAQSASGEANSQSALLSSALEALNKQKKHESFYEHKTNATTLVQSAISDLKEQDTSKANADITQAIAEIREAISSSEKSTATQPSPASPAIPNPGSFADEKALLAAIGQSVDWQKSPLPGKWKVVSADPTIVSQKETEAIFGTQPKRILIFCHGSQVYEAVLVYMESGYNMNLWKKADPDQTTAYNTAFEQLKVDLPKTLEQVSGSKGQAVTLTANAPNFSFNVTDYAFSGLILRLYIEDKKSICLLISKPEDATPNLLRIQSPEQRRHELVGNVVHTANGDVLISHLPIIDQDGRPYCGPAVWTEISRYYGLNVFQEMMLSDGREGGKGVDSAADLTKVYTPNFDFEKIRKSIDSGNPVWFDEPGHVALITGYNAGQNEIFRTDSWGEGSRNKRVPLETFLKRALGFMYFAP
jgi:hypothetical protein